MPKGHSTQTRKSKDTPAKVHGAREPFDIMAPKAVALRQQGYSISQIAVALGRGERQISKYFAWYSINGKKLVQVIPQPLSKEELSAEARKFSMYSAVGFFAFFHRFSGRKLSKAQKQWVRDALSHDRVLINLPSRHGKSTIFSVWFVIWLICLDRDVQIILISQTDTLAKKFSNEIAHHLEDNMDLVSTFGRFRPDLEGWPWRPNAGELMVMGRQRDTKSGDLTLQVRGSGQQILGMEADWVIVDDPVNLAVSRSVTQRETVSDWFHGDVMSRLDTGDKKGVGHAVVVGQRVHLMDLYGELAKETNTDEPGGPPYWKHINYPAVLQWPDPDQGIEAKVLWPEKWTYPKLMKKYRDMGKSRFESMMQQNPLGAGERLAEREWIYGDDLHVGCVDTDRPIGRHPKLDGNVVRAASLDPSPTRYAGFIIADLEYSPTVFQPHILEIHRDKMSVRDMLYWVNFAIEHYHIDYFIFERVAAQRWFLQQPEFEGFRRRTSVIPHDTGRNKGDKDLGIGSLAMDFEFGRIRLPYADAESRAMSEMLVSEAMSYPEGETDDLLMALWFMKYNFARMVPRNIYGNAGAGGMRNAPPRLQSGFAWAKPKEEAGAWR